MWNLFGKPEEATSEPKNYILKEAYFIIAFPLKYDILDKAVAIHKAFPSYDEALDYAKGQYPATRDGRPCAVIIVKGYEKTESGVGVPRVGGMAGVWVKPSSVEF
jgi:hypothetical protein